MAQFLPDLADLARLTHFAHCLTLQETLWRALPGIAQSMGKRAFKPYLEEFIDPMFRGLVCGHRLCEAAAGQCIGKLRDWMGPAIFAGRLSEEQRRAMEGAGMCRWWEGGLLWRIVGRGRCIGRP